MNFDYGANVWEWRETQYNSNSCTPLSTCVLAQADSCPPRQNEPKVEKCEILSLVNRIPSTLEFTLVVGCSAVRERARAKHAPRASGQVARGR